MLVLPCPWCGERLETEFSFGGDAARPMPALAGPDAAAAWRTYVYDRANPSGPHREYWHHTAGCRRWLIVERDTRDHRIVSAVDARGAHGTRP